MNFIEGVPKSNHYSVILFMVDRHTKYAYFILLSHPYNVAKVAKYSHSMS